MLYFGIFGLEFENNFVIIEISTLEFVQLQNFAKKQKCLNLASKMPYLGIFGLEFEETNVIFETRTLEFVYLQNFAKKKPNKNA